MLVRDRMSRPVVTTQSNADYKTACRLMQDYGVRHLPVVNAAGELAGMLSDRDVSLAALRFLYCPVEVGEVMQRECLTCTADTPVDRAVMMMLNGKTNALPVVEDHNRVVGIITETDIYRAFLEVLPHEASIHAGDTVKMKELSGTTKDAAKVKHRTRANGPVYCGT